MVKPSLTNVLLADDGPDLSGGAGGRQGPAAPPGGGSAEEIEQERARKSKKG